MTTLADMLILSHVGMMAMRDRIERAETRPQPNRLPVPATRSRDTRRRVRRSKPNQSILRRDR
jgi:hypothetical protein